MMQRLELFLEESESEVKNAREHKIHVWNELYTIRFDDARNPL